jgi:Domain of unknown function (DUF4926)
MESIRLLGVVALLEDIPEHGLTRGQVGTVVEILGPDVYEVEFADKSGRSIATLGVRGDRLLALHPDSLEAA